MLDEGFRDGAARGQGFDVLGLHSADEGEEVLHQVFDDGEEGAVAEEAVGAGYGPVVGDWRLGGVSWRAKVWVVCGRRREGRARG